MSSYAVIFDVDGVLVDSYQAHFLSWRRLFGELTFDYPEAEFAASFGRTSREILRDKLGGGLSESRIRELDERKEELYRAAFRENFVPMAGAAKVVDDLAAAGFKLGIGSSGPTANVMLALELLNLGGRFLATVTGADVTRGKPDPQVFLVAAERLGAPADHCAVVEDAPYGIEAANRAGMISIGLTGTVTRDRLAHATLVIDQLGDLTPERVRRLIERR
jgi:beta-phosphoglucomutase